MKRIFDLIAIAICAPLLAPIFIIVALTVKFFIGSPIIFSQKRPGLHGKVFAIFKFRTMEDGRQSGEGILSDAQRITRFGALLRSTSLDELPELWNVIKGDMSLVGPRPLLVQYISRYSLDHARRHEVRPGITGLAQINGRNAISWEEKFNYDVWYVDNQNFWLDLKILFITCKRVVLRKDINASESVPMPEFLGNEE